MRVLFITTGFLPYTFSENLCNGKLVFALQEAGIEVDVISRVDEGPAYDTDWKEPWLGLKEHTYEVRYPVGNKIERMIDVAYSGWKMGRRYEAGVRWARRAYNLALKLISEHHYDAVLTRSPTDTPHIVGFQLKKNTGIRWIANWNDPAAPIWPEPYTHHVSAKEQKMMMKRTEELLAAADVNTFPSESLQHHFEFWFPLLKDKKCMAIPHIALPESIMPSLEEEKTEKLWMCHSGNLSAERNPENLFMAMRELIEEGYDMMALDIMGHINEYTAGLIKKYRLEEYVKCPGSYPYLEAIQKMSSYQVLVLVEAILEKGIFFPSKLTDYAQLGKPIFAVSPANGFAHDMMNKYGGGVHVDNSDYRKIKEGLKKLYESWQEGTLSKNFSSSRFYEYVSSPSVVEKHKELLIRI